MVFRKCLIMVVAVSMLMVLLSQNCFAAGEIKVAGAGSVASAAAEIVPGQVIVAINLGYESTILNDTTLSELGVASYENVYKNPAAIEKFLGHSTWIFYLREKSVQGVYNAINRLTQYPCVVYAQPNYIYHTN